jgi:beta-lactamase superfamily II metal-dependent hydrolase
MPPQKDRTRKPVKTYGVVKKRKTRSQTKPERDARVAAIRAQIAADAAALALQRAQDVAARPPAPAGNRGDGQLHMAFIRVGQGDCAVMSTPAGQVVVFDCGTDSKEGETDAQFVNRLQAILSNAKFLRHRDIIDVLIMTHPDTDHYNQLENVLGDDYTIHNCYHSDAADQYSAGQTSTWVAGCLEHQTGFKRVVHNRDNANGVAGSLSLNGVAVPAAGGGIFVDRLDGQGGILIVNEPNCKVSILAAGVTYDYNGDSSNFRNRGSVVTLIEANGVKILMCGDATISTEQYLRNTNAARITNLRAVQAGHHGSINTSSSQAFINLVNPQLVVASAGRQIVMHHLPSKEVIRRYVARLTAAGRVQLAVAHETSFYVPGGGPGGYNWDSVFHKYEVFTTGSRNTVYLTIPAP